MTTRAANRKQVAFLEARKALESLGTDAESVQQLAVKCGVDYDVAPYQPYGGAMSFAELAANERGREIRQEYDELNWQLRALMNNILNATDLTDEDRATRITSLAEDFAQLADSIPASVDAEMSEDVLAGMRAFPPADAADAEDDPKAKKKKPSFLDRFKKPAKKDDLILASSFKAFKEGDAWRWFAVYSNTLQDKTKERFGEKSHRDFIAWADSDPAKRMPDLWSWHTPIGVSVFPDRLGMGKADMLDYADGMALAAGYFYPEFEADAKALAETPDLGTSHGYQYDEKALQGGTYSQYFTFEISPLPRDRAANEATLFLPDMSKELTMQFSSAKREHLVKIHGETKTAAMEKALTSAAESAGSKEAGLGFKDFEEALITQAPAAQPVADNSPVPAAAPAGAPSAEDALAAISTIVAGQVKAIVDPLIAEVNALKSKAADFDSAVAAQFGPRVIVDPSKSPTAEGNNPVNANSREVKEAKAGNEAPQLPAGLAHLQWYAEHGGIFEQLAAAQANGVPA